MPDFDFMNPYNFVPLEPMQAGKRQKPALHHDVDAGLNHGRLVCHVYALSPIFVPDYSRLEEVHLPPLEMRNGPPKRRSLIRFSSIFQPSGRHSCHSSQRIEGDNSRSSRSPGQRLPVGVWWNLWQPHPGPAVAYETGRGIGGGLY